MDPVSRNISTALTVLTWAWDIYAQAHGIPYTAPDYIRGIILAPWGAYVAAKSVEAAKSAAQKATGFITKKNE